MESLTTKQSRQLAQLENVIEAGVRTFVDVGNALMEIREARLYRQTHTTFEDYCKERWGFSMRHANRLISSACITERVGPTGPKPQTESQARPLTKLPPEQQSEAWSEACERSGGQPTAKQVDEVVRERTQEKPPPKPAPTPKRYTERAPVSDAATYAYMAISQLERIRDDDPNARNELERVNQWINNRITTL